MKDYIFVYIGSNDTEEYICSATDGNEAMKKFNKEIGKKIVEIKIVEIRRRK